MTNPNTGRVVNRICQRGRRPRDAKLSDASLRTTLDHLAVENGGQAGPWLDELENELITDASNIWPVAHHWMQKSGR